jgi:hypothetical protein
VRVREHGEGRSSPVWRPPPHVHKAGNATQHRWQSIEAAWSPLGPQEGSDTPGASWQASQRIDLTIRCEWRGAGPRIVGDGVIQLRSMGEMTGEDVRGNVPG